MSEQDQLIVYGHPTCPMMGPVLGMLKQADVPYTYINIHQDEEARARVREINNGNESVPTLVFPDGSTMTEPSAGKLRARLKAEGYPVPWTSLFIGNAYWIVLGAVILFALLRLAGVI